MGSSIMVHDSESARWDLSLGIDNYRRKSIIYAIRWVWYLTITLLHVEQSWPTINRRMTLMLIVIIQTNMSRYIFKRRKCLKQETQKEERSYKKVLVIAYSLAWTCNLLIFLMICLPLCYIFYAFLSIVFLLSYCWLFIFLHLLKLPQIFICLLK